ncbi:MAG: PLP-dependent transferase [Firmicutes bacterium]|jgi:methionine-gamma-lyase|nr:PLP-dependent transferase [Candidatus Fermentithermobacillaceae bacterium]
MTRERRSMATRAVHAGGKPPPSVTAPKVPPIYTSSVFTFDYLEQIDDVYEGRTPGYVYSRQRNPGIDLLEEAVSSLECGSEAVAFASGMAAITCSVLALAQSGDHVVAGRVLYGGTHTFFKEDLPKRGVETTFVDTNDLDEVRSAVRPNTKLVYCETISNPLMEVADLAALSEIAHGAGALLVVDNTFVSPVLCRPLEHGADISINSTTKYLNGHSDVTGGVAVCAPYVAGDSAGDRAGELRAGGGSRTKAQSPAAKVRALAALYGPTPSPFDAWLTVRGLRTVDLRIRKCSENALRLARFLAEHPKVGVVHYPGLESSSCHALGKKYLSGGYGGMLSFELRGGTLESARALIDSLRMVELVPSLAGVSTTVSHPGKTSHRAIPPEERGAYGVGDGLIRVSVGIEDYADIEEDFRQALDAVPVA